VGKIVIDKKGGQAMATPAGKAKLIIDIDASVKEDFQIACIKNNTNMTQEISKFINQYLKKKGLK
jgi:hypothetical protein